MFLRCYGNIYNTLSVLMCVHQDDAIMLKVVHCISAYESVYCPNDDWNIQSNIGKLFSELTLVSNKLLGRR